MAKEKRNKGTMISDPELALMSRVDKILAEANPYVAMRVADWVHGKYGSNGSNGSRFCVHSEDQATPGGSSQSDKVSSGGVN